MTEAEAPPVTVLFVEDEPLIRVDLAEFLRECGYRVHEAANAEEAVALLEAKYAIDVVFTDINLPGKLNGIQLAEWVGENRPGVKVLVATGGVEPQAPAHLGPILRKPYTGRDLQVRIQAALGRPED